MSIEKRLPINWNKDSTETISSYATNITVQHTDNEFILSFWEIIPPMLLGDEKQIQQKLESINEIEATCVGRIVMSINKFESVIKALQENYESFLEKKEEVNS